MGLWLAARLFSGRGLVKRAILCRAGLGTGAGQGEGVGGLYFEAPEPRAFIRAFVKDVRH